MLDVSRPGFHAADVEPGDGAGVFAELDGEFFFAVEDAVAGVLDDDGDELAGADGDAAARVR